MALLNANPLDQSGIYKLTNAALPTVKPSALPAPTAPTYRDVDQAKDTVQGQLGTLLNQSNPLWKFAETNAKQRMNARGVLDSSMAAGEGVKALLSTALPIAQQDASTYYNQGVTNQGVSNQYNMANLGHAQNLEAISAQGTINERLNRLNAQLQAERDKAAFGYDTSLKQQDLTNQIAAMEKEYGLRGTHDTNMLNLQAKYEAERQAAQIAAQNQQQAADIAARSDLLSKEYALRSSSDAEGQVRNLQQTYTAQVDRYSATLQSAISNINTREGLSDDQRRTLINNEIQSRNLNIQLLNDAYSKLPGWDSSWSTSVDKAYQTTQPPATTSASTAASTTAPVSSRSIAMPDGTVLPVVDTLPTTNVGPVYSNGKVWTWNWSKNRYISSVFSGFGVSGS